jgi:thioesterase domain-containing protein
VELRWVLAGGDIISPQAVDRVYTAFPDVMLVNGYGPTENTTFSTCYQIPRAFDVGQSIPIGGAIKGSSACVLDEHCQLVPAGAVGELYVGGRGVARGYLNRDELTEERFIANPFVEGDRLYKSGDLVRWRNESELEFIGREDNQVKIRGFRIELGELEHQLLQLDEIKEAVVLARRDMGAGAVLVAYVVMREDHQEETEEAGYRELVLAGLRTRLPDYMLPSHVVSLSALPLTANGKINRSALPLPDISSLQKVYVAPKTEVESQLCAIWEDLLKLEQVGVRDNFFELGGQSLLSIQLVSRINQHFGRNISVKDVFQSLNIETLARKLGDQDTQDEWQPLVMINSLRENCPFVYFFPGAGMPSFTFSELATGFLDKANLVIAETDGFSDSISDTNLSDVDVRHLAQYYCNAIKDQQENGPYLLIGFSFGGILAFEVAKLLELTGAKTQLVLLDSYLNKYSELHQYSELDLLKVFLKRDYYIDVDWLEGLTSVEGAYTYLMESKETVEAFNRFFGLGDIGKNHVITSIIEVYLIHFKLLITYRPNGIINGQIKLVRAEDSGYSKLDTEGLLELLSSLSLNEDVQNVESPGDHRSMVKAENIQHVVKHIMDFMEYGSDEKK